MDFFVQLQNGWNLGNTLDVHGMMPHLEDDRPDTYETLWGNPPAARALFETVRGMGFQSVRIPVTWYEHMDTAGGVDAVWMARVRQVVDFALEGGLFAVLNTHHDNWFMDGKSDARFAALWGEIAATFADCGERLLFESMNEPRLVGAATEWSTGSAEVRQRINRLNEVFVGAVRGAGGEHNAARHLLVPTYCAAVFPETLADFQLPDDDRVAVSVHLYRPYHFALDEGGTSVWSRDNTADTGEIDVFFDALDSAFASRGIPTVVTEFGAADKQNLPARTVWADYIVASARRRGIPLFWWDAGGEPKHGLCGFSLLDRRRFHWRFPSLVAAISGGA